MSKRILGIGVDLASDDVREEDFDSRISLLDWDVILFRPSIDSWISYGDQYKGKPSLSEHASFRVKEASEHWRREIKQAVELGKTVVVFLSNLREVYIDTGERQYLGTGKNQKTTRVVKIFNNYSCLPLDLEPVNSSGTSVKMASKGAELFAPYWNDFSSASEYKVIVQSSAYKSIFLTRNGEKTVGVCVRSKSSGGALICFPDIDFYRSEFLETSDDEDDEDGVKWTPAAYQFSARLVTSIVALDGALHAEGDVTPEPPWSMGANFALPAELELRARLLEVENELEKIQRSKEEVQKQLAEAGSLRALLYEKGKPLEISIINALTMLGFDAKPFRQDASEFDVVFESSEGRLIGEAEGKDSKAINVDKLRQLSMNIHEDLQREDVNSPAKGILLGNPFRLVPPVERTEAPFTEKCVLAAKSNGTALLTTSQLFTAVQYLLGNRDEGYAARCRQALVDGVGFVLLPSPPVKLLDVRADIENLP